MGLDRVGSDGGSLHLLPFFFRAVPSVEWPRFLPAVLERRLARACCLKSEAELQWRCPHTFFFLTL